MYLMGAAGISVPWSVPGLAGSNLGTPAARKASRLFQTSSVQSRSIDSFMLMNENSDWGNDEFTVALILGLSF
jgi:hypothetical protein